MLRMGSQKDSFVGGCGMVIPALTTAVRPCPEKEFFQEKPGHATNVSPMGHTVVGSLVPDVATSRAHYPRGDEECHTHNCNALSCSHHRSAQSVTSGCRPPTSGCHCGTWADVPQTNLTVCAGAASCHTGKVLALITATPHGEGQVPSPWAIAPKYEPPSPPQPPYTGTALCKPHELPVPSFFSPQNCGQECQIPCLCADCIWKEGLGHACEVVSWQWSVYHCNAVVLVVM